MIVRVFGFCPWHGPFDSLILPKYVQIISIFIVFNELLVYDTQNKKDFVPQDLIEKLTASVDLKEQQQTSNLRKGFNPRNYLLKFENAIEQIRSLRNEVDEEIKKSSETSKKDEANYKSQLSGFMTDLHDIMRDFRILDGGISKVSQTAIRIGDRLENVELQRQEILESEELISHFLRFNKDKKYRDIDPMFFAETGDDLYKAAKLIIKLHEIGTDLTSPETLNARDEITNIANRIKLNLREEFIRAYQCFVSIYLYICHPCTLYIYLHLIHSQKRG